jgi:thiamine-phosphate diphosphorylase
VTLCLVTDRRRLGRAVSASPDRWGNLLILQIRSAIEAGVDLIQLRETDLAASDLFRLASTILEQVPGARTRLIVNERLDVALSAGAAGVHLRQASFAVGAARRIAPTDFLVGRSVHDVASASAASGADYLIAGTVLSTPSKAAPRLLGWTGVREIVRVAGGVPVLGIGGLTAVSMPQLAASGAAGVAAIGAFIPDSDRDLRAFVQETVQRLRFVFDSTPPVP